MEGSLYEQVGGEVALGKVVDTFHAKCAADAIVGPFFGKTDMANLKKLQIQFFSKALGGPDNYEGRSMKDVHVNMKVGEAPFVKLMELLGESLKENGVSADLTQKVLDVAGTVKGDVVTV